MNYPNEFFSGFAPEIYIIEFCTGLLIEFEIYNPGINVQDIKNVCCIEIKLVWFIYQLRSL